MKRILFFLLIFVTMTLLSAQAPSGVGVYEGPVVVASLAACYWPVIPPTTQLALAECLVVEGSPVTMIRYYALNSAPTAWISETQVPLTKAAVLALGITVSVPAHPAQTGTLQ